MPDKETNAAESMDFMGEIKDVEASYECLSCFETFTISFTYENTGKIPPIFHHEECPEDPSWQR